MEFVNERFFYQSGLQVFFDVCQRLGYVVFHGFDGNAKLIGNLLIGHILGPVEEKSLPGTGG